MADDKDAASAEQLLDMPNLADALESDRFKQFLDHVPFAVAVSGLAPSERIIYANIEFERLIRRPIAEIQDKRWSSLLRSVSAVDDERVLSEAIADDDQYLGEFTIQH